MKPKFCVALSAVTVLLASPLWAWRMSGDSDERAAEHLAFAKLAMAEAQKSLDAGKPNQARFFLIAICDLCVPAGGNSPKVPDDVIAAYKALYPKAWPEATVSAEAMKAFDAAVKENREKFAKAYIDAFYIGDNADTYSISRLGKELMAAEAKRPAALALAEEFCAKAIPPEEFTKYFYQGNEGSGAIQIQKVLANLFAGPETIRQVCKSDFVPAALAEVQQALDRSATEQGDPLMLKWRAGEMEEPLGFVFWADPENAQAKDLQAKAKALREKAKAIYAAQIKDNRVPPDAYQGGDAADLKAAMKKIFKADAGDTILRVVIPGTSWREQAHVWTGINAVDVGWYKLIDGAVVVKKADATCWVHPVTFGRRWTGEGDNYGELVVYGWADQYEILPANVNK